MEKVLEEIKKSWYCKSLYRYTIAPEHRIPVLIVEEFVPELVDTLSWVDMEWWIVLTMDDLHRGWDVYGVILNHMRFRSELIWWNDLLSQVPFSKETMHQSVEYELRRVCIDLREAILLWQSLADLLPTLMIHIDRIWYGCGYLLDIHIDDGTLSEIVYEIEDQWNIDQMSLYQTLHHGTWSDTLMSLHKKLLDLLAYIDMQ